MKYAIKSQCLNNLPKLAWLAVIDKGELTVAVFHGSSVEVHDNWMVEGVWDGLYEEGMFHRSEHFFGSGLRVDQDRIFVVPSSAVVDRIFYCDDQRRLIVSNSLIHLLAFTGASLDHRHDYWQEATSIFQGERAYQKQFKIIHPHISCFHQVFYENLIFSDGNISFEARHKPREKFTSFEEYYGELTGTLKKISDNYQSPHRRFPLAAYTTISSGYDSTAVSALVADVGVQEAYSSRKSNSWLPVMFQSISNDDGTVAAQALGLKVHYLEDIEKISEDELFFWATTYAKHANQLCLRELFYHSMLAEIEQHCQAAVIFTGLLGDKIWNTSTPQRFLSEHIIDDVIDHNLSEVRLKSGIISIPVPFMFIRNIADIVALSRSEAMAPWRVNNNYDRPIPRRIAETAGVKRGTFAVKKKGAATTLSRRYPYNKILRKRFFAYLKREHGISAAFVYTQHYLNQLQLFTQKVLSVLRLRKGGYRQNYFWKDLDMTFYLWLWSVDELKQRMTRIWDDVKKEM